jgi:hypothetical protein
MVTVGSVASTGAPIYEVIRREDIMAAFRDALNISNTAIMSQLDTLIELETSRASASVWHWGMWSRWGLDVWG